MHYSRWRRRHIVPEPCNLDGCDRPVNGRGLCSTHYARHRRAGTLPPPRRGGASYRVEWRPADAPRAAWVAVEGSRGEILYARGVYHGLVIGFPDRVHRIVKMKGDAICGTVR